VISNEERVLNAIETWYWRRMLKIWTDIITNEKFSKGGRRKMTFKNLKK
jgi:hypothetical protein